MNAAGVGAAAFMAAVALRTGLSMESAAVGLGGAGLALGTLALRRRPVAPTPGLSFIVLSTGALLGYLALGDVLDPMSWGARYPLPGGVALAIMALLLWVLAAQPPARPGRLGEAGTHTLLVGGLALLALLPLPPNAPPWAPLLVPGGVALGVAALVAGRGRGGLRLALALPVLAVAPLLAGALADAPRPLVRLLWALAPDRTDTQVGYDPLQPLRALAFLSPSDRPVARLRAGTRGVPGYLVGNRLATLDGRGYVWSPAPPPRLTGPAPEADVAWYALAEGSVSWQAGVELIADEAMVFLPPDTLAVGVREGVLQAGRHGVLEARFEDGARRAYQVRGGVPRVGPTAPADRDTLTLPDFWDGDLDAAARALGGADAAATAQAVGQFLRARAYTLDTRLDPRRPFHDFFLNGKPAYCFWYATGAVLALRANGVPARVVSGYLVSERLDDETYIVRERDAHAWAEWQDGSGRWHTLDPTPPSYAGFFQAHQAGAWRRARDHAAAAWARLTGAVSFTDTARNALVVAGLAVLAFLFVREYRRLRETPGGAGLADARVTRLWRRFLRRARLHDDPAWTCARYARELPPGWSPARRAAALAFLERYGPVRFGAAPVGGLPALQAALRRFETTR